MWASMKFLPILEQPRSQGLSSGLLLRSGEMRDPGNEVDFDRNEEKNRKSKYRLRTCEQKGTNALLGTGRNVLA